MKTDAVEALDRLKPKPKDDNEAWHAQTRPSRPYGWIQWKGTSVCMDVHCVCGALVHIDGDFTYNVRCAECRRIFACNGFIELVELGYEPENYKWTDKEAEA